MSLASRKLIQATAGNAAGAVDTGDDDFANVVLLLDGDGTSDDNNETFTDSSTNGFTVTENGSVVQGSFSPYGDNWSNYFDGSDRLNLSSVTAVGTSDATIEFWFWASNETVAYRSIYDSRSTTGTNTGFGIFQYGKTIEVYGNGLKVSTAANAFNGNEWVHFALVRSSGSCQIYINGTASGSSGAYSSNLTSTARAIGDSVNSSFAYYGYISNLREDHSAVYTSGFTPSTRPLATLTNTKVLTCSANRFLDESTNAYSITVTGTPKVTPFSPFKDDDARDITTDGGSGYFDGTGDYLTAPSNSAFAFGTGDYTVELWIYPLGITNQRAIIDIGNGTWQIYNNTSGQILFYNGGNRITSTAITNNAWYHIAISRESNATKLFVNGTQSGSTYTDSTNYSSASGVGIADRFNGGLNELNGYISDVRIVKGTAIYTSAFTPPTAPLTAITNTELLLSFQDAGIYDRTGINNLDTVGNAQIDTAVKKYGTGSIQFDGTGDYIEATDALISSDGPFTFECWAYWNDAGAGNNMGMLTSQYKLGESGRMLFGSQLNVTDPVVVLRVNGGTVYLSGSISESQWHHIAWVYDGTTHTLFVDGTSADTSTTVPAIYEGVNTSFGGQSDTLLSGYKLDGYMDDIRITKGVARYTSNFTPPTEEHLKF